MKIKISTVMQNLAIPERHTVTYLEKKIDVTSLWSNLIN